jgi:hypothetical protein
LIQEQLGKWTITKAGKQALQEQSKGKAEPSDNDLPEP